ncbi:sporulation protein YqfD [Oscillospiraceae bacterium OttesenSCG-928-G22]|nr:sporulation protein YqfD [Oscillospiraceae bacterium OttesenSCG-928-G22]
MLNIVNFFRGYVILKVQSPYPERFLNICSRNNVAFWKLKREADDRFLVRVYGHDVKKIEELAGKALAEVRVVSRVGAPFFLMRFRKRYLFIAGFLLTAILLYTMSLYVWEIEVDGCGTVSEERVLKSLRDLGFGIGFRTSDLDADNLQNSILLEIPELRWITVNITGSRAFVEVQERGSPPEVVDVHTPANIVARKTGVVSVLTVREGSTQVTLGETVEKGQLLVSGIVDSGIVGARFVHAMADIEAMTWYSLEAEMPLGVDGKEYTGAEKTRRAIRFADTRINLYQNSGAPYAYCDKISKMTPFELSGNLRLPITLVTETYREYTPYAASLDEASAIEVLRKGLYESLLREVGDGEIVSSTHSSRVENGMLIVTLLAECREQIAETVEIPRHVLGTLE